MGWVLCKCEDAGWGIFENEELREHRALPHLSAGAQAKFSFESLEELEDWLCEQEKKRLKKEALSLLVKRDHSSQELIEKLKKKGGSNATAKEAVDALQQSGIVRDGDYLERSVMREFEQGYGPKMIAWRLAAKKFKREAIEEAIRRQITSQMEREKAEKLAQKLARKKNANWPKVAAALSRRGFSSEVVSKIRMPGIAGEWDGVADVFHAGDE